MTHPPLLKPLSRVAVATALLLLVPLVAMQFSDEMRWGVFDFVGAGALLFVAGAAWVIGRRRVRSGVGRWIVAAVVLLWLAAVWSELAVGWFD